MTLATTNHAPSNSVPTDQTIPLNQTVVFSAANGNAITVSDADNDQLSVSLFVSDGTLTADTQTGTSLEFFGTAAEINASLAQVVYTGSHQPDSLVVETLDDNLESISAIQLQFSGIDHAPSASLPAAQTIAANGSLTFNTANGNAITVTDSDNDTLTAQVSVQHGKLAATASGAVTIAGAGSDQLILTGSAADIDATLDTLSYQSDSGYHFNDLLTFDVGDGGFNLENQVGLTATTLDHEPQISVPGGQVIGAGKTVAFSSANGNALTFSDADGDALSVTLSVAKGTLSATQSGAASVTADPENGTFLLTASGSAADVNATLNTLVYQQNAGQSGPDTLNVDVADGTFSTSPEFSFQGRAAQVQLAAVDLAPGNSVPGTQILAADGSVVFSAANGNAFTVDDPENGNVSLQLLPNSELATLSVTPVGQAAVSNFGIELLISGPVADVNATLDGLKYQAPIYYHGGDIIQVGTSDGTSNISSQLQVAPAQKFLPPANLVPGEQSIPANGAVTFSIANNNAVTISAPGGDIVQTTITVQDGTLTAAQQSFGTASVQPTDADHPTFTIVGTAADITTLLDGLQYQEDAGSKSADALDIKTTDGVFTIESKVPLTPAAQDSAPTVSVPGPQTLSAQHAVTFSGGNGNAITVADADADTVSVKIFGDNGSGDNPTATAAGGATLNIRFGDVQVSGSVADVNATLNGLQWSQGSFFQHSEALHVQVSDGVFSTERDLALLDPTETDHAPVTSVPDTQTLTAGGAVTFSSTNTNGITIVDADNDPLTVTLKVNDGLLTATAAGGANVSVEPGDEFDPTVMTITGTATDITNTLNGLAYQANAGFRAPDTLTVQTADASFNLTSTLELVPATPDHAPVTNVPVGQFVGAGGTLVFSAANHNAITVSDADNDALDVTLDIRQGTFSGTAAGAATFTTNFGFAEITGSVADVNATLDGLTYHSNGPGDDTLQIDTSDGTVHETSEVALAAPQVDHAPSSSVPAGQLLAADGSRVFSAANNNSVTVVDLDGDQLTATMFVENGTLHVTAAGAATVSGNGGGDISITGSAADINSTLDGLTYQQAANQQGQGDTISLSVDEVGSDSFGNGNGNQNHIGLTAPASHAPGASLPGGQIIGTDGTIAFSGTNGNAITVSDSDSTTLTVTLSANNGGLTATPAGAATAFNAPQLVIHGSVADVNATLATLIYQETANYHGNDLLDVRVNDGAVTTEDTLILTGRNHSPSNHVPTAQTIGANGSIVFSSSNGNPVNVSEADNDVLQTTVTVGSGILTATAAGAVSLFGSGSDELFLTGGAADITATLNGMTYQANGGVNDVMTVETAEQSFNSFPDGTTTNGLFDITSMVGLTAATIDNAPTQSLPGEQTVAQGQVLAFNSAGGNAITVADIAGNPLSVDVSTVFGTLTATAAGAAQVSSPSFTHGELVITGSAADITSTLATLQYHPFAGFHGDDTLSIDTSDSNLQDADTIGITVTSPHPLGVYTGDRSDYDVHTFMGDDGVLYTQVIDRGASGDGVDIIANATHLQFADAGEDFAGADLNHMSTFAGSRFDDVLVQNDTTGALVFAQMSSGRFQSWQPLESLGTSFQAVGSGNIEADASADFPFGSTFDGSAAFLQNAQSGEIIDVDKDDFGAFVELVTPNLPGTDPNQPSPWHLRAVADVNGDGAVDAIVQSDVKGEVLYGDVTQPSQGVVWNVAALDLTVSGNIASDFKVVGAGDINRDGFADIVIQNQVDGTIDFINMENGQNFGFGTIPGLNATWQVKAVADVNGDGYADIIVQHQGDGQTIWANMAGGTFNNWGVVANVADGPAGTSTWAVQGVADVNNDGHAEVIFQNAPGNASDGVAPGTIEYAQVDGGGINTPSWAVVGIVPGWHVV